MQVQHWPEELEALIEPIRGRGEEYAVVDGAARGFKTAGAAEKAAPQIDVVPLSSRIDVVDKAIEIVSPKGVPIALSGRPRRSVILPHVIGGEKPIDRLTNCCDVNWLS